MSNEKIKAIIFDWGGVLSKETSLRSFAKMYAPKFKANSDEFEKLIVELWLKARVDEINSGVFWEELANFLKIDKKIIRKDLMNYWGLNNDVFNLVKKLKKNYKLAILSNHLEDWLEEIILTKKLGKLFDVITASYKFKKAKPDISIFNETIKQLKVSPQEIIYVDDLEKNIALAKTLGMKPILFKNTNQLIDELNKLGVKY